MEPRIKIFTRSFDLKLYSLSKVLYEDMGYPTVRLTDQSADGYFYTMLKDTECDIAVNIDEDAFITNHEAIRNLIRTAIEGQYANIGYSDGDKATTNRNKTVTNPFFNIFNLSLIRTKFDRSSIRPQSFEDREPYYPFFFWLADNFKTLYLPCERHSDGITTVAKDTEGNIVCLHTWFSRFYSMPTWLVRRIEPAQGMQKERIDAIINEAYLIRVKDIPLFSTKDKVTFIANKIARWIIKVPQRISRWPWKLKRKLSHKHIN